jgi:hypothetical protein
MRQSFDNIEFLRFPGHEYLVGYAPLSGVWHITGTSGAWYARCATTRAAGLGAFHANTLAEVSSQLQSW